MRICELCGKEYERGLRRYCSSRCYHRAKEGKAGKTKVCEVCGREFITTYGSEKYCSENCKKKSILLLRKKYYQNRKPSPKQPEEKRCAFCGKKFIPQSRNSQGAYCSKECRGKARWKRKKEQEYGSWENYEMFLKKKRKEKIEATLKRKQKEKEERTQEKTCVVCGAVFKTINPAQKTCSKQCAKRWEYSRKQRRIPKDRIIDKDITLEALYRRDSGVCYLCGKPCDWNDRDKETNTVGALYPTIDHLIPLAHGGTHAWKNIRLAHFACNVNKSDTLLPDLDGLIPENALEFKREIRSNRKKQVSQYTKQGEWVATYESTAEAERKTGIKQKGIQHCARGEAKSYGGFVWRYGPYVPPTGV
jgi:5-methylcytosine-specific restriction endonuclease McrA